MALTIVVIGASLGGLSAIQKILTSLPRYFPLPIALVQHREKSSTELMVEILQSHTAIELKEPVDKEPILPGKGYIAPPDYHLLIDRPRFALSLDPPVHCSRPSIDVLFESAADAYSGGVLGILLTGASEDGAEGLAAIKRKGGYTIVQDPATSESAIMPNAALRRTKVDAVLTPESIGMHIANLCFGYGK